MSIIIFCGPSITSSQLLGEVNAVLRPPAARGDVLRAALSKPDAIALIDGYFDRTPSVWHKEILWAMSQGIHVFGAASMGALRAAELAAFGMEGVGVIFEGFRDGLLSSDDEVSVAHDHADAGFRLLSEALVNIRATLAAADMQGVIGSDAKRKLERLAEGLFYPERCYPTLLREAETAQISSREITALRHWLPTGRVDQKLLDSLALARTLRERERAGWQPKTIGYKFARTDAWEGLEREVRAASPDTAAFGPGADLEDELLAQGIHGRVFDAALARLLSSKLARQQRLEVDPRAIEVVAEDFRRERGLLQPEQFDSWVRDQALHDEEIVAHFRNEAEFRRTCTAFRREMERPMIEELRTGARLGWLAQRARAKRRVLDARGQTNPQLDDANITPQELWRWYFEKHLGRQPPADLANYALDERVALRRLLSAVLKEWCYEQALANDDKQR